MGVWVGGPRGRVWVGDTGPRRMRERLASLASVSPSRSPCSLYAPRIPSTTNEPCLDHHTLVLSLVDFLRCVLLKDKLRHIKHFKLFEQKSIQIGQHPI